MRPLMIGLSLSGDERWKKKNFFEYIELSSHFKRLNIDIFFV